MTMNRRRRCYVLAAAISTVFTLAPLDTWGRSASGYRGSVSAGGGSGSASGRYGGSASWQAGSGGSATTARGSTASFGGGSGSAQGASGGSASWSHGSGTATSAYGNSASWNHNAAAYGYRPPAHYAAAPYPAAVRYPAPVHAAPAYYGNTYNATTGEMAAAGMAGVAVGAMAGSAAAKKQQSASTTQAAAPPPSAQQPMAITSPLPIGSQLSNLPAGCTNAVVKSVEYYGCGPNWFKPFFGSSGVYYQVVQAPF